MGLNTFEYFKKINKKHLKKYIRQKNKNNFK